MSIRESQSIRDLSSLSSWPRRRRTRSWARSRLDARQALCRDLATDTVDIYPSRQMQKMSKIILGVAAQALAQPTEKSSREAVPSDLANRNPTSTSFDTDQL